MRLISFIAVFAVVFAASLAKAEWAWNIGYHNPPSSQVGLNFAYFWTKWAFEIGIGYVNIDDKDKDNKNEEDDDTNIRVGGGINMKYLFSYGVVRPYLQGGFGMATGIDVGDDASAGAGLGGGYFGGGLYIKSSSVHVYASYNVGNSTSFLQAGLGFPF